MKASKRARLLELFEATDLDAAEEAELAKLIAKARAELSERTKAARKRRRKRAKLRDSMLADTRAINPAVPASLRRLGAARYRDLNGKTNSLRKANQ